MWYLTWRHSVRPIPCPCILVSEKDRDMRSIATAPGCSEKLLASGSTLFSMGRSPQDTYMSWYIPSGPVPCQFFAVSAISRVQSAIS